MRGICHAHPSIHDFYRNLLAGALGYGFHDSTDLLGDPTLAANDLAHVCAGNMQLQDSAVFISDFPDCNSLRISS